MKEKLNTVVKTTQRIVRNGEQFIQAVALLVVAGFSYYASSRLHLNAFTLTVVDIALIIIGVRGAFELVKFLDKE